MNSQNKIIRTFSDVDVERNLIKDLRNRNINQKFRYIEGGAELYYKVIYSKKEKLELHQKEAKYFRDFLLNNLDKSKKTALIVLGCGNADSEKLTLESLQKEGVDFSYFGVDYSEAMLELAIKNLKDLKIKKTFICADIISDVFEQEIVKLTKDYEQRIFAFIGGSTFNNTNQTAMADKLFDMMLKDDLLWIDCPLRKKITDEHNLELFLRCKKFLKDNIFIEGSLYPFKYLNIKADNIELFLEAGKEKSVWSLLFTIGFLLKDEIIVLFAGKKTHLLKGDKIPVLNMRVYHLETLASFFENYEFELVNKMITMEEELMPMGQLLFRK